jgi:hypothetical protein
MTLQACCRARHAGRKLLTSSMQCMWGASGLATASAHTPQKSGPSTAGVFMPQPPSSTRRQVLTEAAPAHARATPVALGALHELVVVLGALAAEGAPLAGAATHVACSRAATGFRAVRALPPTTGVYVHKLPRLLARALIQVVGKDTGMQRRALKAAAASWSMVDKGGPGCTFEGTVKQGCWRVTLMPQPASDSHGVTPMPAHSLHLSSAASGSSALATPGDRMAAAAAAGTASTSWRRLGLMSWVVVLTGSCCGCCGCCCCWLLPADMVKHRRVSVGVTVRQRSAH